ncbi:HAD family hydrolase [Reinekea blandensis]|uniref:Phosphoglycolate phosphatase n=1 Tax=Reinekea blandensis MED297 TaxID=314283 RepID=A4BJJ9_9GAMM|nr:HAD hydrolase-like protein [Reinekea blandensis]EAR07703.1 hypothetical protein MED297_18181 [Reinekea sp. MED297] [Reinekea blandensis MED297]
MVTLLWDLDGTLIDSMPVIGSCLNRTVQAYGEPALSDDEIRPLVGPELSLTLQKLIPEGKRVDVAEAKAMYRRFYRETMCSSPVFDGLVEVVDHFRSLGMNQFVATAKYQALAQEIIDAGPLQSRFTAVYGSEENGRLGNKVELLAHIHQQEGFEPANTLMIGDTVFDMEAARANNLTAIAVNWGYGDAEALRQAGAHFLVDSPAQLKDVIRTALDCGC